MTAATQSVTGIDLTSLGSGNLTLTYSLTLTDVYGNVGQPATASAVLDRVAPSGYTITPASSTINSAASTDTGFTFAAATTGTTYNYTVTSSGNNGATSATGSGSVTSATQQVTGVNVSSLPDGTLTFSVTLTDVAGNVGSPATATAVLNTAVPAGYSVAADQALLGPINDTAAGFTISGGLSGETYSYTVSSSGNSGATSVTGSGSVTAATQRRHRHQRLRAARRHADLQRHAAERSRQCRRGGQCHGHARHDGPQRLRDRGGPGRVERHHRRGGGLRSHGGRDGHDVQLHRHQQRQPRGDLPSPAAAA